MEIQYDTKYAKKLSILHYGILNALKNGFFEIFRCFLKDKTTQKPPESCKIHRRTQIRCQNFKKLRRSRAMAF